MIRYLIDLITKQKNLLWFLAAILFVYWWPNVIQAHIFTQNIGCRLTAPNYIIHSTTVWWHWYWFVHKLVSSSQPKITKFLIFKTFFTFKLKQKHYFISVLHLFVFNQMTVCNTLFAVNKCHIWFSFICYESNLCAMYFFGVLFPSQFSVFSRNKALLW